MNLSSLGLLWRELLTAPWWQPSSIEPFAGLQCLHEAAALTAAADWSSLPQLQPHSVPGSSDIPIPFSHPPSVKQSHTDVHTCGSVLLLCASFPNKNKNPEFPSKQWGKYNFCSGFISIKSKSVFWCRLPKRCTKNPKDLLFTKKSQTPQTINSSSEPSPLTSHFCLKDIDTIPMKPAHVSSVFEQQQSGTFLRSNNHTLIRRTQRWMEGNFVPPLPALYNLCTMVPVFFCLLHVSNAALKTS